MADPTQVTSPATAPKTFILTNAGTTAPAFTVPQTTPTAITSGAAYPMGTNTTTGVIVQADPANTTTIEVGYGVFTLGNGLSLSAGDSRKFPVSDAALIFAASSLAAQKLRFLIE